MYQNFFDRERYNEIKEFFLKNSNVGEIRTYDKGEHIDVPHNQICIIRSGRISKLHFSKDGKEKILYFLGGGGLIGELQYFEEIKDNSIFLVTIKSEVSILTQTIFDEILKNNPIIYRYLLLSIVRKCRILESQVVSASFGDSLGRVADVLLRFFYQKEIYNSNEKKVLYRKHTHYEIAQILGCSRVTVTKCLNRLEELNLIEIEGGAIIIKDSKRLREYITWK